MEFPRQALRQVFGGHSEDTSGATRNYLRLRDLSESIQLRKGARKSHEVSYERFRKGTRYTRMKRREVALLSDFGELSRVVAGKPRPLIPDPCSLIPDLCDLRVLGGKKSAETSNAPSGTELAV